MEHIAIRLCVNQLEPTTQLEIAIHFLRDSWANTFLEGVNLTRGPGHTPWVLSGLECSKHTHLFYIQQKKKKVFRILTEPKGYGTEGRFIDICTNKPFPQAVSGLIREQHSNDKKDNDTFCSMLCKLFKRDCHIRSDAFRG